MLAELVERGGADKPELAAGEHGFEHVAGVHGALAARPGTDDGVQLIDEGDDLAVAGLDLLQDRLEALLEFTAVFRARDHGAQVEADEALVAQALRDVAVDDALGQPLDDGGLSDAGFADEDRVVLRAPGEDLDDPPDLGVAADDGIELAVAGRLGEVGAVLGQRLPALGGHLGSDLASPAEGVDLDFHILGAPLLDGGQVTGLGEGEQEQVEGEESVPLGAHEGVGALEHL